VGGWEAGANLELTKWSVMKIIRQSKGGIPCVLWLGASMW